MAKLQIDDYTKGIDKNMVRTGSPLHDFPFTDSLAEDSQFERDSSPVYTAGLFRTSRGPDRVQLASFNPDGDEVGGVYVFENGVLVTAMYRDFVDFYNTSTGATGSIGLVGDDLELLSSDGNINLIPDSAGGFTVNVAGDILPTVDVSYDIGSASFTWRTFYVQSITTNIIDGDGSPIVVDGDLVPATSDTYDLGQSSDTWKDLHLGGNAFVDNAVVSSYLAITDGITALSAVSGLGLIFIDAADGDLKIRFSDGTLKVIVTD